MKKKETTNEMENKETEFKVESPSLEDQDPKECEELKKESEDETVSLYELIVDFTTMITQVIIAIALVFCAISVTGINESLAKISENGITQSQGGNGGSNNQEGSQPTSTLFELDYAKDHDIMPADAKETFSLQDKEYFVFFYQTGCGYCVQSEPYIEEYIKAGKTDKADVYMVNLAYLESEEQAAKFWDLDGSYTFEENPTADSFKVTGTPTMLHIKDGKADAGIGPDEIAQMLSQIQ